MTFIAPPVGLILANNGVSPWKEYYHGSSSSSSWSSYSHDDSIDKSYLSDKKLIDAVKNYYPYIKNIEIEKYDNHRRVKCYFGNDFLEKVNFALHTHPENMYYVVDKKGKTVTPYYANKKLTEEWISKQPTTEKWLWFELKNDNFKIKRKIMYIRDEEK